jgi:hypothetical protein
VSRSFVAFLLLLSLGATAALAQAPSPAAPAKGFDYALPHMLDLSLKSASRTWVAGRTYVVRVRAANSVRSNTAYNPRICLDLPRQVAFVTVNRNVLSKTARRVCVTGGGITPEGVLWVSPDRAVTAVFKLRIRETAGAATIRLPASATATTGPDGSGRWLRATRAITRRVVN